MTTAILIENKPSYVGIGMLQISGQKWLYGWLYKGIFTKIIKKMTGVMLLIFQTRRGDFGYIGGHMQLSYVYVQLSDCGGTAVQRTRCPQAALL